MATSVCWSGSFDISIHILFGLNVILAMPFALYSLIPNMGFMFFFLALQTNTSAASSLGTYFLPQITLIFLDMLNVYRYEYHIYLILCFLNI